MCLIEMVASPTIDIVLLSWKSSSAHVLKGFAVKGSGLAWWDRGRCVLLLTATDDLKQTNGSFT